MSRRDARKAIAIRLPEEVRRGLVARSADHRPLAFLLRGAVLAGLRRGPERIAGRMPGRARPILLQLSAAERARVEALAARSGCGVEEAVLGLAALVV